MDEFEVIVDEVVRFRGTFQEAHGEAQALRRAGQSPLVRRARPGDPAGIGGEESQSEAREDEDFKDLPF